MIILTKEELEKLIEMIAQEFSNKVANTENSNIKNASFWIAVNSLQNKLLEYDDGGKESEIFLSNGIVYKNIKSDK